MKRAAFTLAFLLLLGLVGLLTAELALRVANPAPRRVVVRADRVATFELLDSIPVWQDYAPSHPRTRALEDADCEPDGAFVVMLLGDSIFNGIEVPAADNAGVRLKAALQQRYPDDRFCVVNLAVPGFSLYQSLARGRAALPALHPQVVLLELWGGPPRVPVRVRDRVYLFEGVPDDPDLTNPLGSPRPLHAALFGRSALYTFASLATDGACGACRLDLAPHRPLLDRALADIRDQGGALVTFMPPWLDHPFEDQPAVLLEENAGYTAWTEEHQVRNVPLWHALTGHDPQHLRIDSVHFNGAGHALLAQVFLSEVTPLVDAWRQARLVEAAP